VKVTGVKIVQVLTCIPVGCSKKGVEMKQ